MGHVRLHGSLGGRTPHTGYTDAHNLFLPPRVNDDCIQNYPMKRTYLKNLANRIETTFLNLFYTTTSNVMASRIEDYILYQRIKSVPGWLNEVTAHRTIDILTWQEESDIAGNLLEIGVFCGRYFSILLNSGRRTGSTVLGIDTFQFVSQEQVISTISSLFGDDVGQFTLWNGDSSRIQAGEIIHEIGRPRFVSIDGAHDFESVFQDLVLVDQILSPDGIVAADDALNPLTLGVNQAINVFLSTPRNMVPVAYIANKLFLSHRSRADDYRQAIEALIIAADDPQSANFRKQMTNGRHHIEQIFWGHKVLIS